MEATANFEPMTRQGRPRGGRKRVEMFEDADAEPPRRVRTKRRRPTYENRMEVNTEERTCR